MPSVNVGESGQTLASQEHGSLPSPQATAQHFNDVHAQGLRKKQLFKEYLSRHGVMDAVNAALQQLFMSQELPGDPVNYLGHALIAASQDTKQ